MIRLVRLAIGGIGVIGISVGAWHVLPALPRLSDVVFAGLWGLGPVVLSDALLMPALSGIGWLLGRAFPVRMRTPITVGMIMSLVVLAISWPFLGGFGRRPDNPTLLDLNYAAGVGLVLAIIWLAVGITIILRRRARTPSTTPGE